MSASIPFDRAAEYYDDTRGLSPEGVERTTRAIAEALGDAAPVLEVGVGTGQVAIPLREAGLDVIGLDLSRPMLEQLRRKGVFVPVVEADATRMPFRDDAFGGKMHDFRAFAERRAARPRIRLPVADDEVVGSLGERGGKANSPWRARLGHVTGRAPGSDEVELVLDHRFERLEQRLEPFRFALEVRERPRDRLDRRNAVAFGLAADAVAARLRRIEGVARKLRELGVLLQKLS